MSKRYWGIVAAVGLGLACANHAYAESPAQKAGPNQSIAESLEEIATTGREQTERAKRADEDESPCGQRKYGSDADLCAQWKAADAAADSAWWAWVAGIATIISTSAVLIAIALTYQANSIARDTAKRQLRAYVGISRIAINKWTEPSGFWVQFEMLNSGQTPAYAVETVIQGFIAECPLQRVLETPTFDGEKSCPLMPGQRFNSRVWVDCEDLKGTLREIEEGRLGVYLNGACQYKDAFGVKRQTTFTSVWSGEKTSDTTMEMYTYVDGNSAT